MPFLTRLIISILSPNLLKDLEKKEKATINPSHHLEASLPQNQSESSLDLGGRSARYPRFPNEHEHEDGKGSLATTQTFSPVSDELSRRYSNTSVKDCQGITLTEQHENPNLGTAQEKYHDQNPDRGQGKAGEEVDLGTADDRISEGNSSEDALLRSSGHVEPGSPSSSTDGDKQIEESMGYEKECHRPDLLATDHPTDTAAEKNGRNMLEVRKVVTLGFKTPPQNEGRDQLEDRNVVTPDAKKLSENSGNLPKGAPDAKKLHESKKDFFEDSKRVSDKERDLFESEKDKIPDATGASKLANNPLEDGERNLSPKKRKREEIQCANCKKMVKPQSYSRHCRTHQSMVSFKCTFDGCGVTFSRKDNLASHINKKHASL